MISCTRVSGLRLDAEEPQTRAAGEGRMLRSTGGGDDIYRYAYLAVYKLTQGSKRRKDVQFHRGRGETCGRTPPASEAQIPHSQPRSPEAKIEHLGL